MRLSEVKKAVNCLCSVLGVVAVVVRVNSVIVLGSICEKSKISISDLRRARQWRGRYKIFLKAII